ncbi:hypothetical protein AUP68_17069 [Ilyonectria robusta]|nr:hypothetical protein BKA56DRAFT_596941 [Ilyonectria sp. MPI-CAGE-AT-0026]
MPDNLQIVDGRQVTVTDVNPPKGWTNDYIEMGGEIQWGLSGDATSRALAYGIEGDVKPLFATQSWTGQTIVLFEAVFEAGSSLFFLYNAIETTLFQIMQPTDLQSIVSTIGDEDKGGLAGLELEER